MDFNIENWDNNSYNYYLDYLKSLADIKYKKFNLKIINTKYEMLGIKVPILRKIAKSISKGNIEDFLKNNKPIYYEEVFIRGLVIASIKDINILKKEIKNFIKYIDNWAVCDSFCSSLKTINLNKDNFFDFFKKLLNNKDEYNMRVSLVVFLNFYIDIKYLNEIFNIIDSINTDKYYVNMAISWLLCEMYTKYKEETLIYLKQTNLNDFVINKTISKVRESYRISNDDKELIKQFKR